jgi:hypothetical protein
MHSNFGFDPQHVMLAETDLHMAGYTDDRVPQMQRRMLDAVRAIPGVTAAGYANHQPLGIGGGDSYVYTDSTTDYRPTNYAADAMNYRISPGYLDAAGTKLLAGRDLRMIDDKNAPKEALVNRQFAVKVFGSVQNAVGGHFKYYGGQRAEVVGVVEDGKYRTLTEDQQPAMFFQFQQEQSSGTLLVVRSNRDPAEIAKALEGTLHGLDAGLPLVVRSWTNEMSWALFAARVASVALGVLGMLGAMLAVTGIFGMASYTVSKRLRELGIRMALGARRRQVLRAGAWTRFRAVVGWLGSWNGAGRDGVQSARVYRLPGHAEGSDGPGWGCCCNAGAGADGCVGTGPESSRSQSHYPDAGGVANNRAKREGGAGSGPEYPLFSSASSVCGWYELAGQG